MLVYPGDQVGIKGVVPSMRLKWLRDGVEDYDYVQILKNLGKEDVAMQIARSVGPDWTNWTRDAASIESARHKLGETISEIMTAKSPSATVTPSSGESKTGASAAASGATPSQAPGL
jgi:hypothetical protein